MDESTDSINAAERARSNYSVHRLKGSKVPKRYGETRGQYLWRLLRVFIKETIESVAKSDVEERVVGHGVSFLRSMRAGSRIKSLCYDIHQKEVVALESSDILNFYMSDGRFVKNMFAVDLNQDTTNKFIKYIVPNKSYDTILYCSHERQFLGWKKGEKEINLFSSAFELLSVAKSPDPIDCLGYNSRTGDVATCSSNNEVTLWNFRYGAKHLIPKATYKNFLVANRRHNFIVIEPSDPPMIRCYIVSNIDVTVINLYDGTVISTKDELHIRQITAVTFYNRMKYLITASKEGSIKVWDQKWFLKMVFVGHNGCVNALAIHPFSSYVISAGADRTLRVWSLDQQDVIEKLDVDEPVLDITTEFGNPKFITYSSDMIKIWKVTHIYEMFTNIGRRISKLTELNHRQFPKRTLVQCESGGMHLVNPATGNVLTSLIIDVKEKVVDSVYAVCEDTVFVYLENGDLLKVNAKANPCRIIQRKTDFPKPISTMLIYEYYSDGSYEPEKQDFDSEFNYLNQTSSVYKTLKTKSPKELSGVKLKGFDRTLLFAGCKDGSICMLRWDNLEIDYEVEMHNSREVLQLVANVKEDQLISAGNDLIIKVWRVFPYAAEPLTLLRNIFCAYSPEFVCLLRDRICVAYNDPKTLTHSIVFFNRQSNERYDHRPEVDHTDRITAISSCEKMKLLASASMDGSLRIWDINCQLIRCIKLKEKPDALAYCSTKADLLVAIGNHVFKIYSKSYLPKTILFKMVGMEFEELKKEEPIPYNSDVRDTLTPTSFQRLKSAHKNEFHFEAEAAEIDEAEMEQYENEIFDLEQKQRNEGIFLLMQRDTELNKLYNGEIKPKEKHIKKRVAKEAFNNYMKLFYNPDHKVKFQEPDYFYLSENDIFPKPVIIEKHEQFIYKEPAAFFPPISTAKNKNPHDALLKDYEENRKKNMKKLQEQEQFDQSSDKEYNIESIYMEELNTKNLTEFNKKQQMNETYNSSNTSDSRIEKDVQHKPSKNEGSSTAIDESHNKSPTYLTEVDVPDRKKRPKQTSRTSDKPSPTISPILENRVEEETQQAEYYTASYYKYLDELEKKKKETVKDVAIRGKRKEMESDDRAPYFISGGFIPNSILIRILWPSKELDDLNQKSWKPKALSEEQMEQLKAQKVVRPVSAVSDKDEDTEEKDKRKKSGEKVKPGEAEATEEQPKVKPEATRASLKDKLSDIVKKVATPPPTPPPEPVPVPVEPTKPKLGIPNKDLFKEKSERLKEMKEQMQQTILEKEKTREANEVAAVERAKHREQEEEKARERERTLELEREASRLQAEQLAAIPKVPTFVKPFQETSWFQKYFGEVPIENLPRNEEAFYLELFKKANETVTNDALELAEIAYMLDVLINVLKEREIQNKKMNESLANCVINLIHNAKLDVRDSYHREFLFKCFQLLATLGHNIKNVVIEWMYWYLESIESVRRYIRGLFDAAGICEFSHYFYQEIDSWEVWKIEQSGQRRKQIKKMCSDWLQKWITLFQMHIKDTYEKMRKGPFEGTISKSSKGGILKSGPESRDSKRPVTVKFDLNNEKATVQNVTPIESINYFCEMMHEQEKLKPKNKDNGEEKNTVLVVPKLNTNTVLIRLGESNTDMCRPKQRDEYYLPPIRISSKYTYGDILPTSHINLPMKKVTPFPFRKAVDNITYEDEEAVFDAIEYLKQPYHLITLRTAQKYFIPEQTYTHYLD